MFLISEQLKLWLSLLDSKNPIVDFGNPSIITPLLLVEKGFINFYFTVNHHPMIYFLIKLADNCSKQEEVLSHSLDTQNRFIFIVKSQEFMSEIHRVASQKIYYDLVKDTHICPKVLQNCVFRNRSPAQTIQIIAPASLEIVYSITLIGFLRCSLVTNWTKLNRNKQFLLK